jgi:quinol monooxygenase YgiN
MIVVLGSVVTEEGRVAEMLSLCRDHVARSRKEPGCISHAVYSDSENPQRLVFVEEWVDQQALQEHFKVPASIAFVKALVAFATEAPSLKILAAKEIELPGESLT